MTETVILSALILAALVFSLLAALTLNKARRLKKEIEEEEYKLKVEKMTAINVGGLNKLGKPPEKPLSTPPASESSKKVDWEPDDYKDPYSGVSDKIKKAFKENNFKDRAGPKHRRFDEDELHEVSHMLTDNELRKFGG